MRAKKFTYTMAAAHSDGFCELVTGDISATPWTTIAGAPNDGCSHQTQLVLAGGGSLAAVHLTITGTDAEGRAQSEAIHGPSATTTLANYYKTITSILSDATLGASTMNVGWTEVAYTPTIPVAVYPHDGPAVGVQIGGTINYTRQQSNDQIYVNNPAIWHLLGTANLDADSIDMAIIGATGVRIVVNSHTSGILYVTISQARA
jgi:hypothetical protein